MITPIKDLDFSDYTEGIPAFLTMLFMVTAYSISDGIMFGILSFVLIKLFTGKVKEIGTTPWVVASLFLLKILFKAI